MPAAVRCADLGPVFSAAHICPGFSYTLHACLHWQGSWLQAWAAPRLSQPQQACEVLLG